MKYLCLLLIWTIAVVPAFADEHSHEHGHDHEAAFLGHHWACPEYLGEIHLQMGLMALATALVAAWLLISRLRRVRRCA